MHLHVQHLWIRGASRCLALCLCLWPRLPLRVGIVLLVSSGVLPRLAILLAEVLPLGEVVLRVFEMGKRYFLPPAVQQLAVGRLPVAH